MYGGGNNDILKIEYLVSVCSTTIGVEECFLGKRMSTITNHEDKQNTKYLINRSNLL